MKCLSRPSLATETANDEGEGVGNFGSLKFSNLSPSAHVMSM